MNAVKYYTLGAIGLCLNLNLYGQICIQEFFGSFNYACGKNIFFVKADDFDVCKSMRVQVYNSSVVFHDSYEYLTNPVFFEDLGTKLIDLNIHDWYGTGIADEVSFRVFRLVKTFGPYGISDYPINIHLIPNSLCFPLQSSWSPNQGVETIHASCSGGCEECLTMPLITNLYGDMMQNIFGCDASGPEYWDLTSAEQLIVTELMNLCINNNLPTPSDYCQAITSDVGCNPPSFPIPFNYSVPLSFCKKNEPGNVSPEMITCTCWKEIYNFFIEMSHYWNSSGINLMGHAQTIIDNSCECLSGYCLNYRHYPVWPYLDEIDLIPVSSFGPIVSFGILKDAFQTGNQVFSSLAYSFNTCNGCGCGTCDVNYNVLVGGINYSDWAFIYDNAGGYTYDCCFYPLATMSQGIQGDIINHDQLDEFCPPPPCYDCLGSFAPVLGEKYLVTAWVKDAACMNCTTYTNASLTILYTTTGGTVTEVLNPSGPIIDGWQRISGFTTVPTSPDATKIRLSMNVSSGDAYFDDIRFEPKNASMKTFVYDPVKLKLVAELDNENFATYYEYDEEGKLTRVKKETERGIMTVKESRSSMPKK
jgi:hypothetical protein